MDVKLKAKHIIMLSKLVSKMDISIDVNATGSATVMDLISHIHLAEKEFYELLGDLMGYTPEKAADTEIEIMIDVLSEVVTRLINFIRSRGVSAQPT